MAKENPGFLKRMINAFKPDIIVPVLVPNRINLPPTPKTGPIDDRPPVRALPAGRSSQPSNASPSLSSLDKQYRVVSHQFVKEYIEIIRMLSIYNEDVSQALHNIVSLGNTGHKIFFDKGVPSEQVDKMRNHLVNKRKLWAPGQAGMDGVVNKMFSQLMISGALSSEWVIDNNMRGVDSCLLVNPDEIVFTLEKGNVKYTAWQQPRSGLIFPNKTLTGLIRLNPLTYKYIALNGDTEIPYGIPPYIPVIKRIGTQHNMDTNINFVVDQLGLVGFLEVLIQKPDQDEGIENDTQYEQNLDNLLTKARARVLEGFKEGIVVGFNGDHEFDFKSAAKNFSGVTDLYDNNEIMIASALKTDASLLGRNYNTSETNITVVFMKMLSELRNIQNIVSANLEYGYALELRLAGFTFDYLTVKFNRSTIQDDLKSQQAEEIKIRNVKDKMILGIIDQDTAADELGYEVPSSPKPMVGWDVLAGVSPKAPLEADKAGKKAETKKKKGASEKKKRQTDKPVSK